MIDLRLSFWFTNINCWVNEWLKKSRNLSEIIKRFRDFIKNIFLWKLFLPCVSVCVCIGVGLTRCSSWVCACFGRSHILVTPEQYIYKNSLFYDSHADTFCTIMFCFSLSPKMNKEFMETNNSTKSGKLQRYIMYPFKLPSTLSKVVEYWLCQFSFIELPLVINNKTVFIFNKNKNVQRINDDKWLNYWTPLLPPTFCIKIGQKTAEKICWTINGNLERFLTY